MSHDIQALGTADAAPFIQREAWRLPLPAGVWGEGILKDSFAVLSPAP